MGLTSPVRQRTRTEIVEQASRLFAQDGYPATTLQGIADAVGCSKATVLYHFNGKPALLAEVTVPLVAQLDELVARVLALPADQARAEAITGMVELAVSSRQLVAVLADLLPDLIAGPEYDRLRTAVQGRDVTGRGREVTTAVLAGSDDPLQRQLAALANEVLLSACRLYPHHTDAQLRTLLDTALRRLLVPPVDRPSRPVDGPARL